MIGRKVSCKGHIVPGQAMQVKGRWYKGEVFRPGNTVRRKMMMALRRMM